MTKESESYTVIWVIAGILLAIILLASLRGKNAEPDVCDQGSRTVAEYEECANAYSDYWQDRNLNGYYK